MKKIYMTLLTIALGGSLFAQVTNLDLESWTSAGSYDDPDGWLTVNQAALFLGISTPVEKITISPSQGLSAAKMTTVNCAACPSFGAPDPLPGFIRQETAYTALATSVTFDYKFSGVAGDWGAVVVELTQWDPIGDSAIVIAEALDTIATNTTTWTSKTAQFVYSSSLIPDSIKINFIGSIGGLVPDPTFPTPQSGTELSIDAISIASPASFIEEHKLDGNIYTANDMIHIILSESNNGFVTIYDLTGKQVYQGSISNINTTINTNNFNSGIYIVEVNVENKSLVKKVTVQ
jgi:hypothetical protein